MRSCIGRHAISTNRGGVVAAIDDYAVMYELVVDLVAQGVEATVAPIVRETVHAVADKDLEDGLSIAQLAKVLGVDKSVTSRTWRLREGSPRGSSLQTRSRMTWRYCLRWSRSGTVALLHALVETVSDPPPYLECCIVCDATYLPDELHLERLRCPECIGEAA
jgi:hypothetical protein